LNEPAKPKWLSPTRSGALFYLIFFLSTGSFSPFLYVYYSELGISGQQVGLLATFFPLMTLLFATPLSTLADRKRWRTRMVQAAVLSVAGIFFFMQFPDSFLGIALLMLPLAFCFSPVMSIADSLVARMAQRRNLNYGSMRLWGSVGFASAAFLFGAVEAHSSGARLVIRNTVLVKNRPNPSPFKIEKTGMIFGLGSRANPR